MAFGTTTSLLRQGPGPQLAFLREADPEAIAEILVAFANSEGGTVVLGIGADGEFGDIYVEDDVESALQGALRLCNPPVKTEWQHEQVRGHTIVLLQTVRSHHVHTLVDGRVPLRRGSQTVPASGEDIAVLMASRPAGEFEVQSVPGASRDDLDDEMIDVYTEKRQKRNPTRSIMSKDKLLTQIGALTTDKTPTVSGLLLFGRDPQLFLPQCRTVFVKFADTQPRGPEGGLGYGRREEIDGPLPNVIERAWKVIYEEMDKSAVVRDLRREDKTEYPWSVVREALVNAVAHRDYKIAGRSIEIRMYTDRLEISSPGGLPAHITLDNIVEEHYSRNPRIVNGLYQLGYIEELGLGVDRMIEDMTKAGHEPPVFVDKKHSFTVTLFNKRNPQHVVHEWECNMNERQLKAVEYIRQNRAITNREYRELCPHVGSETLRLDLADLVTKGVLLKIGEKRGTRYILK
ncbi:MAG: putative DNA binding domain-containing protein [Caldilineaceae bacterium]|nr:putative DNA binding domain-containing protein [Caldilineaceae bacterium]